MKYTFKFIVTKNNNINLYTKFVYCLMLFYNKIILSSLNIKSNFFYILVNIDKIVLCNI